MFNSLRDARMRLDGGVIRLDGQPIRVRETNGGDDLVYDDDRMADYFISYSYLDSNKRLLTPVSNPKLNFEPVTLGYLNRNGTAYYVSRTPVRAWKIGLHFDNMRIEEPSGKMFDGFPSTLIKTIKGEYPKFDVAFNSVKEGLMKHCAFSRKFAIGPKNGDDKTTLWYKGRDIVGTINEDKVYELSNNFFFLREELDGVLL